MSGPGPAAAARAKRELRRHYRQLRSQALPAVEAAIQGVARRELAAWLAGPACGPAPGTPPAAGRRSPTGHLGIYWPLAGEVDLRGCLAALPLRQPPPLALPAIPSAGSLGIRYRPWCAGDPLEPDACGIAAPPGADALAPERMALLLLPCLALDPGGVRLGYGGGWFDRLRAAPCWRAVPALGVLPAACLVRAGLPAEAWDVPLDGWIDEHGLHWCRAADGSAP